MVGTTWRALTISRTKTATEGIAAAAIVGSAVVAGVGKPHPAAPPEERPLAESPSCCGSGLGSEHATRPSGHEW